jgi:hypothetical protein
MSNRKTVILILILLFFSGLESTNAQFIDHFEGQISGEWDYYSGDGKANIDFIAHDKYATIKVDATKDRNNIWWALIKRNVAPYLDLAKLNRSDHELRVEVKIKTSHAPRRVNLHFNTQKTTDFHTHLMEYDIPDTTGWHTISMTTKGFKAVPGDTVNAQMALIDWGFEKYSVQVDYFKVNVVNIDTVGPELGNPVPYNPPIPNLSSFNHKVEVAHDAVVDLRHPNENFNNWYSSSGKRKIPALTVSGTQFVILRWNFQPFTGKQVDGYGVLVLTTRALEKMNTDLPELGQIRVAEQLSGNPEWNQENVTLQNLSEGKPLNEVFNPQMITDAEISGRQNSTTKITISEPALQRLIDGKSPGVVLRPLGPIHATFYASEYKNGKYAPRLYFNLKE